MAGVEWHPTVAPGEIFSPVSRFTGIHYVAKAFWISENAEIQQKSFGA